MRGREQVGRLAAVLQAEQQIAVVGPAPTGFEDLARNQRRKVNFLAADGGHLLADDAFDVGLDGEPERQPRVDARGNSAHVTAADEQFVACNLGVGGVVAQRTEEESRHSQHRTRLEAVRIGGWGIPGERLATLRAEQST